MTSRTDAALRVSRIIDADPERVFDAWTQAEQLRQWSCPEDATITDAQVDLRVGGRYRILMQGTETTHTATGIYKEIERPTRLVFTWDWEESEHTMGETLVTVELKDLGNATEVLITHERFPNREARDAHLEGWESCLNRLERLFNGSAD